MSNKITSVYPDISTENNFDESTATMPTLPLIPDSDVGIDLLNRHEIVSQITQLIHVISSAKGSCTFALNGKWGSGKTFVLGLLERQLQEYMAGEQYVVFHYNCWEYDYYDEPLIAIIAALLDNIDKELHLFSADVRKSISVGLSAAKPLLETIAKKLIENKLGIDLTDAISLFHTGEESYKSANETQNYEYDQYYGFKKTIKEVRDKLRDMARDRTVVIVVDELDRCLPNYAIKVLERLHHLFVNVENTVVLLSVDKSQLDNTVKSIFGTADDVTDAYLKKFISFEFTLDIGKINAGFTEKYTDYVALFDDSLIETNFSLDDYFSALFSGIDIRTQERLMERIKTIHMMLFPSKKKDYSFMCFELMWIVFFQYYKLHSAMPILFNQSQKHFYVSENRCSNFTEYMKLSWRYIRMAHVVDIHSDRPSYRFSAPVDIPQLLIWYLGKMYSNTYISYSLPPDLPRADEFNHYLSDFEQLNKLLQIIQ